MLTENNVIDIVVDYLEKNGYKITQQKNTQERGIDIIAKKNGVTLCVEAKGETSSKESSRRFGKAFTKNQVATHVSVAIFTSLKLLSKDDSTRRKVAMAFPDNKDHRDIMQMRIRQQKIEVHGN